MTQFSLPETDCAQGAAITHTDSLLTEFREGRRKQKEREIEPHQNTLEFIVNFFLG